MGVPSSWLYQSCQFSLPVTPVALCILEVHSKCCLPSYLVSSYLTMTLIVVSTSSLTDTSFDHWWVLNMYGTLLISISCQLSIGTKYRPDVLMQWVSSFGSGSMCMNMSRNWTIVTSKCLATVVCSAANFFKNEFCVYEWVIFCSMESGW